jgi:HEPN domain-containing protein
MDFVYGLKNTKKFEAVEYWKLAKQHLEAASATILGSFDKRAIIQNCCISAELLLKGALLTTGIEKETLRKQYGHNLGKLACDVSTNFPHTDKKLLLVIEEFPDYVNNRYENHRFSRLELGQYLMSAQFISGEILRQCWQT